MTWDPRTFHPYDDPRNMPQSWDGMIPSHHPGVNPQDYRHWAGDQDDSGQHAYYEQLRLLEQMQHNEAMGAYSPPPTSQPQLDTTPQSRTADGVSTRRIRTNVQSMHSSAKHAWSIYRRIVRDLKTWRFRCQSGVTLAWLRHFERRIKDEITLIMNHYLEPKEWSKDQIFELINGERDVLVTEEQFRILHKECTILLRFVERRIHEILRQQKAAAAKRRAVFLSVVVASLLLLMGCIILLA